MDICLEAGVNFFDTADAYSSGASEEILGKAIAGRRGSVLISTKATFAMGEGPNDVGSSRHHLVQACEASLRRLNTDYIDVYHLHGFDAQTPIEETVKTLDALVQSGKVRYLACSNFSGWHLMNSLAVSEKYGWERDVSHQVYYSLVGRDYEWELMPLGLRHNVAAMIWSPLGWGRLTGKIRRGQPLPATSRLHKTADKGPQIADDYLYKVVDALDEVSRETEKSVPQIALNWLLQRPTVANVIIGARDEKQLRQNLAAVVSQVAANCASRRRQRRHPRLSVLAPAAVREESEASLVGRTSLGRLFRPQRSHRLYRGGAPGWQKTGKQRRQQQNQSHRCERGIIHRLNPEQETLHGAAYEICAQSVPMLRPIPARIRPSRTTRRSTRLRPAPRAMRTASS